MCPFYLYQEKQLRHTTAQYNGDMLTEKKKHSITADAPYFTVYSLFIHGENTKHILSLQCYISFCRTVFMSCIPLINYGKLSRPDSLPLSISLLSSLSSDVSFPKSPSTSSKSYGPICLFLFLFSNIYLLSPMHLYYAH